jgi:hypothetical protein
LRSKPKKADIRIDFALFPEGKNTINFPPMKVSKMALSAATNEEEKAKMVLHKISKASVESYYFTVPKRAFSDKDHCKMLALYREGKGLVYIFYLFNEASEEVDLQKNCLSFLPKEVKEEE